MTSEKIKFNNSHNSAFVAELKSSVQDYFVRNNISQYANWQMVVKTIAMFSIYFGSYALILTGWFNEWQMLFLCVIWGIGTAGIGFAVQHDANHGAYSEHKWINKLLGFSLSLIGGSDYMWRIKHNILHHTYTNIHGKDEDISVAKFLRLSPNAPIKPVHRLQHVFAWFAYSTLTIFWVFYFDFPKLKRYNGHGSPNPEIKHPIGEVIFMFVMKFVYVAYAIVIPILVLDVAWYKILIGFTIGHMVAGLLLTVVFQLAHVVEDTDHPVVPENGVIENSWFVHQIETTSNFSVNNPIVTWFCGGLNYQVEHHLFPKICSIHYPEVAKIVKEKAQKYGISYHDNHSLEQAVVSHYKTLKKFSR